MTPCRDWTATIRFDSGATAKFWVRLRLDLELDSAQMMRLLEVRVMKLVREIDFIGPGSNLQFFLEYNRDDVTVQQKKFTLQRVLDITDPGLFSSHKHLEDLTGWEGVPDFLAGVVFVKMDLEDVIVLRDRVFGLSELSEKIFAYLDPDSVKAAALVCK